MYKVNKTTDNDAFYLLSNLVSICYNLKFYEYEECMPAICDLLKSFSDRNETNFFLGTEISEHVFAILDNCLW